MRLLVFLPLLAVIGLAAYWYPHPEPARVSFHELQRQGNDHLLSAYYLDEELFSGTTYGELHRGDGFKTYTLQDGYIQQRRIEMKGRVQADWSYRNGQLPGKSYSYYEDSTPKSEDHYLKGQRHGWQYAGYSDGSPRRVQEWMQGVLMLHFRYPVPEGVVDKPEGC